MTTRRRRALLLVPLLALLGGAGVPAAAQTPSVTVSLQSQTAFTTNDRTVLRVAIAATNVGTSDLSDLSMVIGVGPAVESRLAYDRSLIAGPSSIASAVRLPLRGVLEAGRARTFTGEVDIAALPAISTIDSRVYPLLVTLEAAGAEVARIASAQIHLVREPEAPLTFSWWLPFTAGPAFGPDGTFRNEELGASLAPGGSLRSRALALRRVAERGAIVDVVVQPSLVADVADMADGYTGPGGAEVPAGSGGAAAAATFLADLRSAAGHAGVQIVTLPMFAPSTPGLLAAGLGPDLRTQEQLGNRTIETLLGVDPASFVERPVDGRLNREALDRYGSAGVTTLLADTGTVDRALEPSGFAPGPTAIVGDAATPITLVLPDPGTDALLHSTDLLSDPVRAAQGILGELAVIWKEAPKPAPPIVRGLAVALPSSLPPPVWAPLMDRLTSAPFLQRTHAGDLGARVEPPGPRTVLTSPDDTTFTPAYVERIRSLDRDVAAFRSMQVEPSSEPDRLRDALLQTEAAMFMGSGEPLGVPWFDEVASVTGAAFAGATPQVQASFTLTSDEGTLPLRMGDPGGSPLRVVVTLASPHFTFPEGDSQEVTLTEPGQVIEFAIRANGAGRNPIVVSVLAPDGRSISEQTIVVRSTTLNTIALAITVAAAVGLVLLYARRWVRRPTT